MVWHGMLCGMVLYAMWYGMVCCAVWYGMLCGMVCYVVWYGMVWYVVQKNDGFKVVLMTRIRACTRQNLAKKLSLEYVR